MSALFNDQSGVNAPTQSWATFNGGSNHILQLSFYTPVGSPAAAQFGRVMYNEYHVDSTSTNNTVTFPAECTGSLAKTAAFTPQEHMLEYSLFDLMNFPCQWWYRRYRSASPPVLRPLPGAIWAIR